MAATTLTLTIAGVPYPILNDGSFKLITKIDETSELDLTILDVNSVWIFSKGQQVTLTDTLQGTLFTGFVSTSEITKLPGASSVRYHQLVCIDNHFIALKRTTNKTYTNQYAGVVVAGMINDVLALEGVTANYAIDEDSTQANFAQGTLSGTSATSNNGGDLELAAAGNAITIFENSASDFSQGTLTSMTTVGSALGPSATSAMKIQATQSIAAVSNSYSYIKFWTGSITVVSGRYLTYDLWISSSSPEAKIGIDLVFSDGSTLRDNAVSNNGQWFDAQNKGPHPNVDLKGYATDQWYHRSFLMDNFIGKTIVYAMFAIEGDSSGTYTGYAKNVTWLDSGGTNHGTFFGGGPFGSNLPQQMYRQGYNDTPCTIVNTYDCSTANRVSPGYNIDPVKILKSSFLTYQTTLPTGYSFSTQYSIDGGNSYTPCANNTSLPCMLAGQSVSGKTIQFLQSFAQSAGASPETQPLLNSVELVMQPSYNATKSDINAEYTTNAQWNAGSYTNAQAASNTIAPFGAVRNWDSGSISGAIAGQTLFGGGATGPNNANTCWHYVDSRQLRMEVHQSTEGRSRMDFAGTWGDFQMEYDVSVDNTLMKVGSVYRTTGWSNYDGTFAYALEIIGTSIKLFKGSNNAGASSNFSPTQIGSATVGLTSQAMHRIKLIISGSSHQVYFDDTLAINITDATYSAAGNVGVRISNTSTTDGYIGTFDNFGISTTNIFSGSNWASQSISLTGAGTYLNSVIQWDDVSTDTTQVVNNVWASVNGGSTWQVCTNGGPLPNLTLGQSLSGVNLLLQVLFTSNTSTVLPQIQDLTVYVLGGFSSTGTRISPALSLSPALVCGSSVVNWDAITPPGTTVAVATSPNGSTSWTNVNNGGAIAGLTSQPLANLDSFAVDSHLSYAHLNRTGGSAGTWTWDTANSRLTVSGGSSDMQLSNPVWYNTGYTYKYKLTIDHTKVIGGADLSSFPVRVHIIDPNLAHVSNRGLVQNIHGYDIIFSDSTETGALFFEIEYYDPVIGEIEMWVSLATVSHTVDTVFYMYVGNPSISTSQEFVTGVWDSNFKLVMHSYDNAASTFVNDSTSNANDGAAQQNTNLLSTSGQIGKSLSYNGSSDYVNIPNASSLNTVSTLTYSFWINPSAFNQASFASAFGSYGATIIDRNEDGGTNGYIIGVDTTGRLWWWPASSQDKFSTGKIPLNQRTHIALTYSSSTVIMYINGVQDSSQSSAAPQAVTHPLRIGGKAWITGFFQGDIDEVHYSSSVRTAGWIGTEYNSQNSPSTFYSISPLISQPSASPKDVDLIIDSDQADQSGIVWREQDASNFYELDLFDSSSSAGSTNVLKLFKVIANVKTQLGSSTAITFKRGTPYRARVTMIGNAITVYFDGNSVLSTTDSSITSAGKVGLINVTGSAHFYNFRVQPQGQSLSGVNSYTRVTLTSTDPTATPALTDLVMAALHPNINLGALIPTASYLYTYISANMDDLAKKSNTYWKIDNSLNMIFALYQANPAPWVLTDKDIMVNGLYLKNSGDLYRNRQIITGVIATGTDSETKVGDGTTRSWTLGGILVEAPTIYLNNQLQTVGIKGVDTGKQFYWTPNSAAIDQDSSGTILQNTDQLSFPDYVYQFSTSVVVDNTGQFPNTTSQAQFAAISGGTGIVEDVVDVSSQSLNISAATFMANDLLQRYGVIGNELQFNTMRTGLAIGQAIPVFNPETSLNDALMLITEIDVTQKTTIDASSGNPTQIYFSQITATSSVNAGSWSRLLASAFN